MLSLNTFMNTGFVIMKAQVDLSVIIEARDQILELVSTCNNRLEEIVWNPYVGEEDKICLSKDNFQFFFRGYRFPWNSTAGYSKFDFEKERGELLRSLRISEESHGSKYFTWTYYPSDGGFLNVHTDSIGNGGGPIIHYIIPLTFKNSDYEEGGLVITDRTGKDVDVDALLEPGDVLFFDGSLAHRVDPVRSKKGVGRLQAFIIPTKFLKPEDSERLYMKIPLKKFFSIRLKRFLRFRRNF